MSGQEAEDVIHTHEKLILAYFAYVTGVAVILLDEPAPAAGIAIIAALAVYLLRRTPPLVRNIAPLALTLLAYRSMDLFKTLPHPHTLENSWIRHDRLLLAWLRPAIEALGPVGPAYFEFCYLIVYAVSLFSLALLYRHGRRDQAPRLWFAYLAGTLAAYALFPYFPSDPPRVVFPGADNPTVPTLFRHLNLAIVGNAGIHSSVFPSAHVSSAFACAWGLRATLPGRPWIWRSMAIYAASVAIATVYGRYHYTADALAGVAISLVAFRPPDESARAGT
jgi:membrane-associated phospholipid phosphatase